MSIVRFFGAGGLGVVVTLGLLLVMNILIQTNIEGPGQVQEYKVPDIVMPKREIEVRYTKVEAIKPPEAEILEIEIPKVQIDLNPTNESIVMAPTKVEKPVITGPSVGDGDMIPLTVVQPEYPRRAAQQGLEGYCTVEFTVSANGTTKDAFVVDCPQSVFANNSLKASERIKYKPRVVDGQAVDVPGVQYRFLFQMAKE